MLLMSIVQFRELGKLEQLFARGKKGLESISRQPCNLHETSQCSAFVVLAVRRLFRVVVWHPSRLWTATKKWVQLLCLTPGNSQCEEIEKMLNRRRREIEQEAEKLLDRDAIASVDDTWKAVQAIETITS